MSNKTLYMLWGGLFILCAAVGFIPDPQGAVANAMTLLSIAFFIPGAILLHRGQYLQIRIISLVSLVVTVLAIMLNLFTVTGSATDGDLAYAFLVIVSAPMFCARIWVLSLFLWACLLMGSIFLKKKVN